MDRREAVQRISAILGVAVSGPTMAGILSGCQASKPDGLRTLSTHQHELLGLMTEHIIPSTDTPGAMAANVAGYIDAMITDFYSNDRRKEFLDGLAQTASDAREQLGKSFEEATQDEQFDFLDGLDEAAFPDMDAMDEAAQEAFKEQRAASGKPFIATLKELTIAGFYTSEVGATQELHQNPMGSYRGDIPFDEVGKAWS